MSAYNDVYLEDAQFLLAELFETSVYVLDVPLADIWRRFILSQFSCDLGGGNGQVIGGLSGSEIAFALTGKRVDKLPFIYDRTPEFWVGYSLAYYQWLNNVSFGYLAKKLDINKLLTLYNPYHEMDITSFCEKIDSLIKANNNVNHLKQLRMRFGYTQNELAILTGIPLRTIQQYEQGQKSLNKAQTDYILALAKALYCHPEDIL